MNRYLLTIACLIALAAGSVSYRVPDSRAKVFSPFTNGTSLTSVGPQGPAGPQGLQGPTGLTGATGSQGPQGLQGNTGSVGAQGPQGIQGATGATGPNAISASTTVTGITSGNILKNNAGVAGAAVAGTDYLAPTGSGAGLAGVLLPSSPGFNNSITISSAPTTGDFSHVDHKSFIVTGVSTAGTPTTGYLYTPEIQPDNLTLWTSAGANHDTTGNGGRTGQPARKTTVYHYGQGDVFAHESDMTAFTTKSGSTHFLANPALVFDAGLMNSTQDGTYFNIFEYDVTDLDPIDGTTRHDNAVIPAFNYDRGNGTGAKSAVWLGPRGQSTGTQAADAWSTFSGKWKVGFDSTTANLGTNAAAMAIKPLDKIYLNASSAGGWYADMLGSAYLRYNPGTSAIELNDGMHIFSTTDSLFHTNESSEISALTTKTTPVSGDYLVIEDSEASNAKKKITVGSLPSSGGITVGSLPSSGGITALTGDVTASGTGPVAATVVSGSTSTAGKLQLQDSIDGTTTKAVTPHAVNTGLGLKLNASYPSATHNLTITGNTGEYPYAWINSYGTNPLFVGNRTDGSVGSPTAVQLNDTLFTLSGRGYNGTAGTADACMVNMLADGNWTPTSNPTYIQFVTAAVGATTPVERMRINNAGYVGINNNSPNYTLDVTGTSNTTGVQTINTTSTGASAGWPSLNVVGSNNMESIGSTSYNVAPGALFKSFASLGSQTTPAAITTNTLIGGWYGYGWNGTAFGGTSSTGNSPTTGMVAYSTEPHTTTAKGSFLQFLTSATGTTTRKAALTVGNDGGVTIATVTAGTSPTACGAGNLCLPGGTVTATSFSGSGALPVYNAGGTVATSPHIVTGTVLVTSGSVGVGLYGSAVFPTSYVCTGNSTTLSDSEIRINPLSSTGFNVYSSNANDTVAFICIGN